MSLLRVKRTLRLIGSGRTMNKEGKCSPLKTNEKSVWKRASPAARPFLLHLETRICAYLWDIDLMKYYRWRNDDRNKMPQGTSDVAVVRSDWRCCSNIFDPFCADEICLEKGISAPYDWRLSEDDEVKLNRDVMNVSTLRARALPSERRGRRTQKISKVCLFIHRRN